MRHILRIRKVRLPRPQGARRRCWSQDLKPSVYDFKSTYFPTLPYQPAIEKYFYHVLGLPEIIYGRGSRV